MARKLIAKQEIIDQALDTKAEAAPEAPSLPGETVATESSSRAKIAAEAEKMTPARIAAIHDSLRMLAAMDQDFARDQNGMGFGRLDVQIGHSLAGQSTLTPKQAALGSKLVHKYRRQLPAELVRESA